MKFYSAISIEQNEEFYKNINNLLNTYLSTEKEWLAQLSNVVALLFQALPEINWLGFYFLKEKEFIIGPFQGRMVFSRVASNSGILGAVYSQLKTVKIDNVHKFEGYVVCDQVSFSEIAIPLFNPSKLIATENLKAVLNISSPVFARFSEVDQKGLESIALLISEKISWP